MPARAFIGYGFVNLPYRKVKVRVGAQNGVRHSGNHAKEQGDFARQNRRDCTRGRFDQLLLLELLVAKLIGLMMALLTWGVAHADEAAQPVVLPEPNYFGIIVFLVLMIGGGGWFMWKVMSNKGDQQK
jgi:hypothetical protein